MKLNLECKEIGEVLALEMVKKYHYSNTLPKLNKHFLGFYLGGELVGVITLGWGTQPLGTIRKIFPSLTSNDYLEIGRMCMTDEMPRNSESQMIKLCCSFIKNNYPNVKVLFTWADGMLGKCGYVYQSCSFLYCGYCLTDIYLDRNGIKIHPRQTVKIFGKENDKRVTARPSFEEMQEYGIKHYKGKQFKYLKFLCDKTTKKHLLKDAICEINTNYPKDINLYWQRQIGKGKWEECEMPPYKTDIRFNKPSYEKMQLF